MGFPAKKYERLGCLQRVWQVSQEDAYYAVENGLLKTAVWLPLRYVERGVIKNRKFIYERHEHLEGFVGVRPEDSRQIFSNGRAKLRMFHSVCDESRILRLAYEPPQPAVSVRISDLIVLQEHREQFECSYHLASTEASACTTKPNRQFEPSSDYRHVRFKDTDYHFGDVQAKILEMLHDASRSRNPWVHGKTLIYESGSQAIRLRDVFKHKRDWRDLIISNDRGYYRLNITSDEVQNDPTDAAIKNDKNDKRCKD